MYGKVKFLCGQALGKNKEVDFVERISQGYSNETYRVFVDKKEYRVRVAGNNELIDRNNELQILKNIKCKFIYYNPHTGDSVWPWIKGTSVNKEFIDFHFLDKLISLIKQFHSNKTTKVLNHNDLEYYASTKKFFSDYEFSKYLEIVKKYQNDERVLCHNDISVSNLVFNNQTKDLILIDYEWGRLNNPYWDYGNFVKESDLQRTEIEYLAEKADLSISKLYEFIFLSTIYSIQLSYMFKNETIGIKQYRNRLRHQLEIYKKCLKELQ